MKYIHLLFFFLYLGILSSFGQQKKYVTYKVAEGETVMSISKKLLITPYDLLKLNPDIDKQVVIDDIIVIPNKDYDPSKKIAEIDLRTITNEDIVVDNYIYHKVLPKETYYSIQNKYNVSNMDLNNLNPYLLDGGLKIGHVLKIPLQVKEEQIVEIDKSTQPYLVKPKDTKYSIARLFQVSIDYLEQLNPKIKELGLQIGDVILVPREELMEELDFEIYTVQKSETLYSLSNKFSISQEELITANPQMDEGVREGMVIKIPNRVETRKDIFLDEFIEGKKLNVAMMLPFKADRDSLDFENDRLLNITTEFYLGALIAIDSLKNNGLSMKLRVYDTKNSEDEVNKLSRGAEFSNFDVVIGPLFLKNIKVISENLQNKKPIIVSPISTKDHSELNNVNLVQEIPTRDHLAMEMIEYIKSKYTDQKLIVIADDKVHPEINMIALLRDLNELNDKEAVVVLRPEEGYIKPDIFKETISAERENWFILFGADNVLASDVVNNLGVLPEENNISLFAFEKGNNFNKIDNNFLARVNFHYASHRFLDREDVSLKNFISRYQRTNKTYPTKYAIEGFDITYDILARLANENPELIHKGVSRRLSAKYDFIENTSNSILNNGIFIVKYEGLSLELIEMEEDN